ncbi:phosphatase PAP2 family protein [Sediminibacterium sp. C3]|uniref:phosphatase PAP2 family protein n=1 Tax=Sediminibacterium sp. C3 TaxID=1267211 RepID=UPI0005640144|nr:phosphatase PAP2 family protein [Sediminibacterium sp. C3]
MPLKSKKIKASFLVLLFSVAYLVLSYFLIGFKTDQLVLVGLFNFMYYLSAVTRKFILGFTVFIVFWIIFDYMKAFPNYEYNTVSIRELYNLEKSIFGFNYKGSVVTPNEYWLMNHNATLDVLTGIFYLSWIPVPLTFAGVLFFTRKREFFYFSLTFLLVNLLGFCIYYIYPAAPPWYVQQFGFDFIANTKGNTAGLYRFDEFFGVEIFKGLYEKSSNVFAAMPSLHSSYPLIVLYYAIRNKLGPVNWVFGAIMMGIWFAAVYSSHHYVLDVLAGIVCAITGIWLFQRFIHSKGWVHRSVEKAIDALK